MVATPAISTPEKVEAGAEIKLSGSGFEAGSKVRIVLDTPSRVVVGSALARGDGTFRTNIVVPRRARAGTHRIQVVGTGPSGRPMALAAHVIVVAQSTRASTTTPGGGLAEPVLLTVAAALPLATWLVLEMMGWRNRRLDRRATR
ncbi:MAG TPA: hypothetical protein VK425_00230 [Acidimicrobiales bacterium]|nr:hypothetical protein [Acidimicrobiales bacterium]